MAFVTDKGSGAAGHHTSACKVSALSHATSKEHSRQALPSAGEYASATVLELMGGLKLLSSVVDRPSAVQDNLYGPHDSNPDHPSQAASGPGYWLSLTSWHATGKKAKLVSRGYICLLQTSTSQTTSNPLESNAQNKLCISPLFFMAGQLSHRTAPGAQAVRVAMARIASAISLHTVRGRQECSGFLKWPQHAHDGSPSFALFVHVLHVLVQVCTCLYMFGCRRYFAEPRVACCFQ